MDVSETSSSVCRVAEVVRPAAGGIRRHVSDLLEHLDRRQFFPSLFAPSDFLPDRPLAEVPRRAIEIGATTRPIPDYEAVSKLARLLRSGTDIVHAHGLRGAIVGGFAARRAGLPSLFTVHNLLPKMNLVQAAVFRELAGKSVRIVAVSEAVAYTVRLAGIRAEQIVVVPNGVDLSRFDLSIDALQSRGEYGLPTDASVLLAVGRLSQEKGFDVLIAAFALLSPQHSQVRLCIVGDGPQAEALKRQAAPLGDRIRFLGPIAAAASLFAAADVVVVPSRQEGQGIVPLEAMAAGKPVVASRVGGLMETIVEGETGLLVPAGDAQALAGAIEALLNAPIQRADLGAAGRRRVEQEYVLQTQIQKIEAIYRDVFRRTA